MNLTEYMKVLRRQWYVVLFFVAIALAGSAAYTFTQTPIYQAETRLFVGFGGSGESASDFNQGSTFTQQRVKSYTNLTDSPEVLNRVISTLSLPYSKEDLAEKITAQTPVDTTLLNITVEDPSPKRAADIANVFSDAFADYIKQIETVKTADGTSPVAVTVTKPADVPEYPVSPKVPLNLALGMIVGIALGVGVAVLKDQLNTSVSSVTEIEKLTGAAPLGVVPFDKATSQQPLAATDDQRGRTEAFKTLRTNLQFTNVDSPPRIIVITSALPNEGKSTTACNIAMTLALSGASVVLVEGDLRKPALSRYLGVSSGAGLTNVLAGQYDLREVLVPYGKENLAILPSGPTPPNPSELLGSSHMTSVIHTLSAHFDYVLIDAPPLLPVTDAAVVAAVADGALLVVRHGKTPRESVDRAVKSLSTVNAKLLGTVLNFAPRKKRSGGYDGYGYGYGYGGPISDHAPIPPKGQLKPAGRGLASIRKDGPAPANGYPEPVDATSQMPVNGNGVRQPEPGRLGRG